jgi:hypothetical protein
MLSGIVAFMVMTYLDEKNKTFVDVASDFWRGAAALCLVAGLAQIGMVLHFSVVV